MKRLALLAVLVSLAVPASASAGIDYIYDTPNLNGEIINPDFTRAPNFVKARFRAHFTCGADDCDWYSEARISTGSTCYLGRLAWTSPTSTESGDIVSDRLSLLLPASDDETWSVCLYAVLPYGPRLVGKETYEIPTPPPPPELISKSEAKAAATEALSDKYGWRYDQGVRKHSRCSANETTYVCKVGWVYRKRKFKGTVKVPAVVGDDAPAKVRVKSKKRKRRH